MDFLFFSLCLQERAHGKHCPVPRNESPSPVIQALSLLLSVVGGGGGVGLLRPCPEVSVSAESRTPPPPKPVPAIFQLNERFHVLTYRSLSDTVSSLFFNSRLLWNLVLRIQVDPLRNPHFWRHP